jgi:hypothetical protein
VVDETQPPPAAPIAHVLVVVVSAVRRQVAVSAAEQSFEVLTREPHPVAASQVAA